MELTIKVATRDDTALVFRLMEDYYREVESASHPKKHRWAVEKMIDNPAVGRIWLIHAGTELLGYVVLSLGFSLEILVTEAFLDDLYLVPAARSRGVAKRAVKLVLAQVPSLGARAVHIEVTTDEEKKRASLRQLGFQDRDRQTLMTYLVNQMS